MTSTPLREVLFHAESPDDVLALCPARDLPPRAEIWDEAGEAAVLSGVPTDAPDAPRPWWDRLFAPARGTHHTRKPSLLQDAKETLDSPGSSRISFAARALSRVAVDK